MTPPAAPLPHVLGFTALMGAGGLKVALGGAEDVSRPCVVVYPDLGMTRGPLGDPDADLLVTVYTVTVADGPEQAIDFAGRARLAVVRQRPLVAGRVCSPVWQLDAQPVRRDDDVTPAVFEVTAQYRFWSNPA